MKRFKIENLGFKLCILGAIGIYVIVMLLTDTSCPFNRFLGFTCPGCGMTRALLCVLHLDFAGAFRYHMMFWSVPILFWIFLFDGKISGNKRIDRGILIIMAIGFAVNWIHSLIYGIG